MRSPSHIRRLLAIACALALWSCAQASAAQPVGGTRIKRTPPAKVPASVQGQNRSVLARHIMDEFALCLLKSRPAVARDVMASPILDQRTISKITTDTDCLRSQSSNREVSLRFRDSLLRGALYKAAYTQDHQSAMPMFTARPDWSADFAAHPDAPIEQRNAHIGIRNIGACLLQEQPAAVHMTITSSAGSEEERSALQAVTASLSGCVPDGMQMRLSKAILVGLLAEVAQRSATQP